MARRAGCGYITDGATGVRAARWLVTPSRLSLAARDASSQIVRSAQDIGSARTDIWKTASILPVAHTSNTLGEAR